MRTRNRPTDSVDENPDESSDYHPNLDKEELEVEELRMKDNSSNKNKVSHSGKTTKDETLAITDQDRMKDLRSRAVRESTRINTAATMSERAVRNSPRRTKSSQVMVSTDERPSTSSTDDESNSKLVIDELVCSTEQTSTNDATSEIDDSQIDRPKKDTKPTKTLDSPNQIEDISVLARSTRSRGVSFDISNDAHIPTVTGTASDEVTIRTSRTQVKSTPPAKRPSLSGPTQESNSLSKPFRISLPAGTTINCHNTSGSSGNNLFVISLNGKTQDQSSNDSSISNQIGNSSNRQSGIMPTRHFNILIGSTGSVATIKIVELISTLQKKFPMTITTPNGRLVPVSINIKVIMTENAKKFTASNMIKVTFRGQVQVHDDEEEWNSWNKIGDAILHIELRKWADIFLIAPLDANTMGKLANGICDNLLTCTARAWDTSKPLIFCPAMNVHMYDHPLTKEHMTKLQSFGYAKIDSVAKRLACGDVGMGAMASIDTIVTRLVETVANVCDDQDKPSNNSVNLIPASLVNRIDSFNGNKSTMNKSKHNQITIQPVRPQISLPPIQSFDINPLRKRRRKSNPDGSDELQDELESRQNGPATNDYNLASQFSSNNSLSVTIPSLRNNRTSLGLNRSISIKPKTPPTICVNAPASQPRILSQAGSSMARALNFLTQDKMRISLGGISSSAANGQRIINLSTDVAGGDRSIIKLVNNNDLSTNYNSETNKHSNGNLNDDNDYNRTSGYNMKDHPCSDDGDFDPSNLLEQTMITDEETGSACNTTLASVVADEDSVNSGASSQQRQELTGSPIFDTQKFLNMCYDQESNFFKCAICKNKYKTRKSMSRHLKEQHVQGSIFSCQACNVSYKRREKLIKHARERHLHDNMFPQYME